MAVHTGTVIADQRFWHKGRGFAVKRCAILQLTYLYIWVSVRFQRHGIETGGDFVLAGSTDFVVMCFRPDPSLP